MWTLREVLGKAVVDQLGSRYPNIEIACSEHS